ncbi:ASCH domain-containing protein [Fodinicola acaciae]|uniref:ASCH domain-containing protein n=1 Tax=Fodinicola acaciae TaxID=2681555 RepID=UPI0013CFDA24|nr:ASCH domain-containing protein [Fodinicola acaciae]
MLFRQDALRGIENGTVTLAYRRWRRPRVKPGTRLHTAIGMVAIDDVTTVTDISEADARLAGAASRDELLRWLDGDDGEIFRIRVRYAGPDPRIALRADDNVDWPDLKARLDRLDGRGAWTAATLRLIADHPAVRAAELAAMLGRETQPFKVDVRKLKAMGLTESLDVGYRLSPRGERVLALLSAE